MKLVGTSIVPPSEMSAALKCPPMVVTLQRRAKGSDLGMNLNRKVGGALYVASLTPGGVAEQSGVPLSRALVKVNNCPVWNVSSLTEVLASTRHLTAVELEFGDYVEETRRLSFSSSSSSSRSSSSSYSAASSLVDPVESPQPSGVTSPLLPHKYIDEFDPRTPATLPYTPPAIGSLF